MGELRLNRIRPDERGFPRPPQTLEREPEAVLPRDGFIPSAQRGDAPAPSVIPGSVPAGEIALAPDAAEATPVSPVADCPPPTAPVSTAAPASPRIPVTITASLPLEMPSPAVVAPMSLPSLPPGPPPVLGDGIPAAAPEKRVPLLWLRDAAAGRVGSAYDFVTSKLLGALSSGTEKAVGVNLESLLNVDRTMFVALSPGREGYVSGSVPLFQALAEGQASYVSLGPGREVDADHLMRLFSGLPIETIEKMRPKQEDLAKVLRILLDLKKSSDFPVFVDVDGKLDEVNGTESIAAATIASIARRDNATSGEFPDPRLFYRYLLARIDSHWRLTDPWLYLANPNAHDEAGAIKTELMPPWISEDSHDPFGSRTDPPMVDKAYRRVMTLAGGGQPPTLQTLVDVADTATCLDRDLLSGIQTYWIKLMRECSVDQRETLMRPLARAWVVLNLISPDSADFSKVSPDDAPYIGLVQRDGKRVYERYDRAMALSEVVDHTLNGLGIEERKKFLDMVMHEIVARKDAIVAREDRIRQRLGAVYSGLDIETILHDPLAIERPEVKRGVDELSAAMHPEREFREMTPEYAELMRHRDMLKWVADRNVRFGDITFNPLCHHPDFAVNPLIVGEFYGTHGSSKVAAPVSPLPTGAHKTEVLGQPKSGEPPVKMSLVLEGGGGKGFAYVEALKQLKDSLRQVPGQVAIDEYVGTSAGAITAGLLASGHSESELTNVLKTLDFKKFYADYLWLMGGVDPKVRGIDRTGVFSTQKMYSMIYDVMSHKLGVTGRPILFRDLPFKLKVVSTVLNTDLPDDLREKLKIGKDGQVVFSSDTTPNMDAVAAICSSAAVPGFFSAPQMQVCRQTADHARPQLYRMQMVDGGVVNNFPVAEATRDGKRMMLGVPTYFEAPPDSPGGRRAQLTTLDFNPADLPLIDAYNRKRYAAFTPQLAQLVQDARGEGVERVVLSMNLTVPEEQSAPALQGEDRAATEHLYALSKRVGMPALSPDESAALVASNLPSERGSVITEGLVEAFLDHDNTFDFSLHHPPRYNIPKAEAGGFGDVALGVVAAKMSAAGELDGKRFERA